MTNTANLPEPPASWPPPLPTRPDGERWAHSRPKRPVQYTKGASTQAWWKASSQGKAKQSSEDFLGIAVLVTVASVFAGIISPFFSMALALLAIPLFAVGLVQRMSKK